MNPTDKAFPGNTQGDTRTIAEVDAQIKAANREAEALRMADKLNGLCVAEFAWPYLNSAATELRGQHLALQTCRAELADAYAHLAAARAEVAALRAPLELALEYWGHRQQRYKNRSPVWVVDAKAALAKTHAIAIDAKRNEVAAPTQQDDCGTVDRLLRGLGLDPERCRTEAGFLNVSRTLSLLHDNVRDVEAVDAGAAQAIHETLAVHKKPFPSLSPELQSGYLRAAIAAAAVFKWPRNEVAAPAGCAVSDEQAGLMKFYGVDSQNSLIDAQARHIEKLQSKLPPNDQPAFTRVREG